MHLTRQTTLLFLLNLIDGVLTIYWVQNGFATEGNQLMASMLEIGSFYFLAVKIAVGGITVFVLSYWGHHKLARYGVTLALTAYLGLMFVHLATGLVAAGIVSDRMIDEFSTWSNVVFALAV